MEIRHVAPMGLFHFLDSTINMPLLMELAAPQFRNVLINPLLSRFV
jgi:hypothetical protein